MIAGGKFENGARTAAYGYLFNAGGKFAARAAAKGAQGTAMLIKDFVEAGWVEVGTEVNIRTKSGIEGRVDAVLIYKGDGGLPMSSVRQKMGRMLISQHAKRSICRRSVLDSLNLLVPRDRPLQRILQNTMQSALVL